MDGGAAVAPVLSDGRGLKLLVNHPRVTLQQ